MSSGSFLSRILPSSESFKSKDAFINAIRVEDTLVVGDNKYVDADPKWMNQDLEPTPPEKRTWDTWTYILLYLGISFGNWNLGSTMVGIGLNWWQAIVVIFASQLISSIAMAFNSRAATMYHIGYPAVARAVFGMYGSYYFVAARAALAIIWFGVQLYTGSSYLSNMMRAIFGSHFENIPNHIPESMGITTKGMLCFFLFWLIHFFFCFFRPYQIKKFFWFKGFVMVPGIVGVFIYCMVACHGDVSGALPASTSGSLGWFIMHAINSGMGNTATLITNQPDIARWSTSKNAAITSQIFVQPIAVTVSATFGILATAGINRQWGLELWNPWDLLDEIQTRNNHPGARFAIFLAAFCWMIGVLGTNIACNMIPFGSDSALLVPRFVDMRRGFFIVEFLAYAIVPWKIMASAATFTTFLSGYGLFMASVVAIMIAEYFIMVRGNVFVPHLFNPTKSNAHYRYSGGFNIQAIIAYIVGIALPFPGFAVSLGASGLNQSATDMFDLGWLLSFFTSLILYPLICWVWPTENQKMIREQGLTFEHEAKTYVGSDLSENGLEVQVVEGKSHGSEKQVSL
ncbi:allantoin [Penicillium lividum]|nr:allantoin [Penicillium lividum]